jgi:prepilin-type N-terminal cleavage/methylation domain-containing protein
MSKPAAARASFTLIELLIVIAIVAVLSVVVVVVLNPGELLKQSRDSKRLTDLTTLNKALKIVEVDSAGASFGTSTIVYTSLADSSSTCGSWGLPALPAGYTYNCVATTSRQSTDGTGWVPVNFTLASTGSPISSLPIDPVNSSSTGQYYTYLPGGSWTLAALLESSKYIASKARDDGGYDPERFESGSDLTLWKNAYGMVGYWKMDSNAVDSSGNNNNGTGGLFDSGGKLNGAAKFESGASISIPHSISLTPTKITKMLWMKVNTWGNGSQGLFDKDENLWAITSNNGINSAISTKTCVTAGTYNQNCEGGSRPAMVRGGSIPDTSWHHYALTHDQSRVVTYRDGIVIDSANVAGGDMRWASGTLNLAGTYIHTGLIDEVRIYNRALSAAEIQAIYSATK